MALCGTFTVTFLRLWTRAPWTRKASSSGFETSAEAVICLVAKGNPKQQVSQLLPKLQIIRRLSKVSKWVGLPTIWLNRFLVRRTKITALRLEQFLQCLR